MKGYGKRARKVRAKLMEYHSIADKFHIMKTEIERCEVALFDLTSAPDPDAFYVIEKYSVSGPFKTREHAEKYAVAITTHAAVVVDSISRNAFWTKNPDDWWRSVRLEFPSVATLKDAGIYDEYQDCHPRWSQA